MTSDRVIKEAPVPVRGWHCEGDVSWAKPLRRVEDGWSTDETDAEGEVQWAIGNESAVAFLMSDNSKVIVRGKK